MAENKRDFDEYYWKELNRITTLKESLTRLTDLMKKKTGLTELDTFVQNAETHFIHSIHDLIDKPDARQIHSINRLQRGLQVGIAKVAKKNQARALWQQLDDLNQRHQQLLRTLSFLGIDTSELKQSEPTYHQVKVDIQSFYARTWSVKLAQVPRHDNVQLKGLLQRSLRDADNALQLIDRPCFTQLAEHLQQHLQQKENHLNHRASEELKALLPKLEAISCQSIQSERQAQIVQELKRLILETQERSTARVTTDLKKERKKKKKKSKRKSKSKKARARLAVIQESESRSDRSDDVIANPQTQPVCTVTELARHCLAKIKNQNQLNQRKAHQQKGLNAISELEYAIGQHDRSIRSLEERYHAKLDLHDTVLDIIDSLAQYRQGNLYRLPYSTKPLGALLTDSFKVPGLSYSSPTPGPDQQAASLDLDFETVIDKMRATGDRYSTQISRACALKHGSGPIQTTEALETVSQGSNNQTKRDNDLRKQINTLKRNCAHLQDINNQIELGDTRHSLTLYKEYLQTTVKENAKTLLSNYENVRGTGYSVGFFSGLSLHSAAFKRDNKIESASKLKSLLGGVGVVLNSHHINALRDKRLGEITAALESAGLIWFDNHQSPMPVAAA